MSFSVGEMIGAYRIVEQLGQGGMATVYKAYHASLDRYVALKVLHPAFNEDPNFLARFQREARLVAKLDHPNIVPIFDYSEHQNRPYLVMKFIEGETLKSRLSRGQVLSEDIIQVVDAVGDALQFAHTRGILHRDIKPSNVLISVDGGIYLADFGLARIAQAGESTLTSDMILGTPQYISPEQALGKKDLDEGTDIYSFGVMLYELAVGKVPFSADTPFSIIHDHIYSPLPLPRTVNPSVSEEVERVLLKSLAKEREDRFPDVKTMLEAFKNAWQNSSPPIPIKKPIPLVTKQELTPEVVPLPATLVHEKNDIELGRGDLTVDTPAPKIKSPIPSAMGKEPTRKRLPWMWMATGTIAIICCVLGILAFRNELFTKSAVSPTEKTPDMIQPIFTQPMSEIEVALQAIEKFPDDPEGHVNLALAYLRDDRTQEAYTEIEKVIRYANQDSQYLFDSGLRFSEEGFWLPAARLYLSAVEIQGIENTEPGLRDRLYESIYKAFILPEARDTISYEAIGKVDRPLMYIARARHSFYNVDQTQGWSSLADLDTLIPNLPESSLLHGEFYARSNRPREARATLNDLLATIDLAEWIRIEAQNLLESLP